MITTNMTTTSMDMTTTTMTTTLSTTHLLMWVGGRGWSQEAARAKRNQESPVAQVLQIIFHFQSSRSSPPPWLYGCWPTCGKAPRPRKGKMSCFVAEVCGGDEPAVVGVKYLRHILNISFDQKYHSSHKKNNRSNSLTDITSCKSKLAFNIKNWNINQYILGEVISGYFLILLCQMIATGRIH